MEIHVKYRCHGPEGRYRLKSYDTVAPPTMCCERMADEWGGIIDLGLHGFPQIGNVTAVFCTSAYPMANGEFITAVTPISHCPWCGEAVTIVDAGADLSPESRVRPHVVANPNS